MSPITGEDTVAGLRARLEQTERKAAARQRQLERYAADLREVFKQERARAQELRRSYMATVRALSNAVEARDAYTGKHAERVAAYGLELARAAGLELADSPQIEFGFLLHDVGKVAVPDAILFKSSALTEEEYALVAPPPDHRLGDPARRRLPRRGQARRAPSPRALGRQRLPGRAGGRRDPARRARVRGRRRARRADHRPPVPPRVVVRRSPARRSAAGAGTQFDPAVVAAYEEIGDDVFERLRSTL